MKIVFFSPSFSGHLHPAMGIAHQLKNIQPEYNIRFVSTSKVYEKIKESGFQVDKLLEGEDETIDRIVNPPKQVTNNPFLLYKQLKINLSLMKRMVNESKQILLNFKPDLVIVDFTLPPIGHLAESLGIPWWTIHASPFVLEGFSGPYPYMNGRKPPKKNARIITRFFYSFRDHWDLFKTKLFKKFLFFIFKKNFALLGLSSPYREDGSEVAYSNRKILGLSILELEFPRKYPLCLEWIGPVIYTPTSLMNTTEPDFSNKSKYILVTMGTHLLFIKDKIYKIIEQLSELMPNYIFHFTYGDESKEPEESRFPKKENIFRFSYINYDLFLKNYSLVIHHGGAGIIFQCIYNSIPSLVYPVDYDQFDWAARLKFYELSEVIYNWDENNLAPIRDLIDRCINDSNLKNKNLQFQDFLKSYNPGKSLAELIEREIVNKKNTLL